MIAQARGWLTQVNRNYPHPLEQRLVNKFDVTEIVTVHFGTPSVKNDSKCVLFEFDTKSSPLPSTSDCCPESR